jgi:hypothetical protein
MTLTAGRALTLAAGQARQATSFSATIDVTTGGAAATHLSGTLVEQTKPALLAHEKFTVSAAGTSIPGGMETLMTSDAMYLKMSSLSRMAGKPWIKMPFSALKSGIGVNSGQLIRQMQANNPLASAEILPAATNVRKVGTQAINGVPATEYTGSLDVATALTRLGAGMKKLMAPQIAATGVRTARFTVWVDAQHRVRKLTEVESGGSYRATVVMVVTSINQPVSIQAPPASQTAAMPGL